MLESLIQVQTIQIGTEFYRLVEVAGEYPRLAWEETFEDESAWQGGTPNILFAPADTWHMGGFKSREGFPGTSEYGQNTDGRWPNRLLPGPKLTQITLTDSDTSPTSLFEALGRLFVCCGRRIFRIDPSDDSVTLSHTYGTYGTCRMGLRWDSDQAIVGGYDTQSGDSILEKLTALGSPDSWTHGSAQGYRLAAGLDRIFAVSYAGLIKNCLTGKDPTNGANYSDEVQCGETDSFPTALVAYERTVLCGKPEGLFGVDEEGKGIPLIRRMPYHVDNCKGMAVVEPFVFVPHERGTLRFMPGYVESVGLEREMLNESSVRGSLVAFALDGQWIYAVVNPGANLYVVVGRDARPGENSFGPYVWDTLGYLGGAHSSAIHVSRLWDPPRVFFGYGNNVVYFGLSAGGGAPDPYGADYPFRTSGVRYTHRYHFGDWRDKDFLKVVAVGRDCSAATYWAISYSVDGGAYSNLDINGGAMRVNADGLFTFILPTSAKGREVQFKLEYTGASESAMGQLIHFKPYAVPASLKLRHYNLTLHLAGEARHDGGVEQRNSLDQLNDLQALAESSTAVDCKGPWGDISVHPKRVRTLEVRQEGHELPRFLVEFVVQKREA